MSGGIIRASSGQIITPCGVSVRLLRGERAIRLRKEWTHPTEASSVVPLAVLFGKIDGRNLQHVMRDVAEVSRRVDATRKYTLSPTVRRKIIMRDRMHCRWCGAPGQSPDIGPDGRKWHIDHVLARARGGSDDESNLVLACATCNLAKRANDWGAPRPIALEEA